MFFSRGKMKKIKVIMRKFYMNNDTRAKLKLKNIKKFPIVGDSTARRHPFPFNDLDRFDRKCKCAIVESTKLKKEESIN